MTRVAEESRDSRLGIDAVYLPMIIQGLRRTSFASPNENHCWRLWFQLRSIQAGTIRLEPDRSMSTDEIPDRTDRHKRTDVKMHPAKSRLVRPIVVWLGC